MNNALITRVYEVKVLGFDESFKNLQALTKAFQTLDTEKKKLDASLAGAVSAGDTTAITKLTAQIDALKKKLADLDKQKEHSAKEAATLAKIEADAKIKLEKVQQEQIKTQRLKNQESEKSTRATKAEQKAIEDLGNDYKQLSLAYNEAALKAKNLALQQGSNTPAAKAAAAEARILGDKLKELDASVGVYNRNVGNYSSGFTNFANTLRGVRGPTKLLGEVLGIGAQEADQFRIVIEHAAQGIAAFFKSKEAKAAAETVDTVATQANTTATAANTASLGTATGTTTLFTTATEGAAVAEGELATATVATSTAMKVFRVALLATGIGVVIGLIALAVVKYQEWKKATEEAGRAQKVLNEALDDASYKDAIKNVNELRENIQLAKEGFLDKEKVVKQYNETIGQTTGEVKSLDEAEQALIKNGDAYIKMTLYKAAALLALDEAGKKMLEVEKERMKSEREELTFANTIGTALAGGGDQGGVTSLDDINKLNKEKAEKNRKEHIEAAEKEKDALLGIANKFQADAAKIAKEFNFDFFGGKEDDKKTDDQASKLSSEERDEIKRIEAIRDKKLAIENLRVAKLRELRKLTLDEEIQHLQRLQEINDQADQKKIIAIKGNNASEIAQRATLNLDIVNRKVDTNKKIQELNEKAFSEEAALKKKILDRDKSSINLSLDFVQSDPRISNEDKAIAKKNADKVLLQQTESYYNDLIVLAKKYNISTAEIEEEHQKAISEIKRSALKDDIEIFKARIADLKTQGTIEVQEIQNKYSDIRKTILDSEKLTIKQKAKLIEELDRTERRTILSSELEKLNKEVAEKKKAYDQDLISYAEYLEAVAAQKQKAEELSKASPANAPAIKNGVKTIADFIQGGKSGKGGLRGLLKIEEGSDEDAFLGQTIAASYDLAKDALNAYFDAERDRIEQSKQLTLDRIDLEKQQRLAQAQSQAEKESIEKQADAKKRAAEKEAGQRLKKIKKSEAAISLATELANIWSTAFQLGPIAGPILGAVLSGLALARYAMNVKNINAQQFAGGGKAKAAIQALPNGLITGSQNIPVQPNGDRVLATVKPGEVILNEYQQRALGGHATFKAIGVPGFAGGGSIRKLEYGGMLGDNLKPPINPSSFLNNGNAGGANQKEMDKVYEAINQQTENINSLARQTNTRIDNIKVQVVAMEVTDVDKRYKKATAVGTL